MQRRRSYLCIERLAVADWSADVDSRALSTAVPEWWFSYRNKGIVALRVKIYLFFLKYEILLPVPVRA